MINTSVCLVWWVLCSDQLIVSAHGFYFWNAVLLVFSSGTQPLRLKRDYCILECHLFLLQFIEAAKENEHQKNHEFLFMCYLFPLYRNIPVQKNKWTHVMELPVSSEEVGVTSWLPPYSRVYFIRHSVTVVIEILRIPREHIGLSEEPVLITYKVRKKKMC